MSDQWKAASTTDKTVPFFTLETVSRQLSEITRLSRQCEQASDRILEQQAEIERLRARLSTHEANSESLITEMAEHAATYGKLGAASKVIVEQQAEIKRLLSEVKQLDNVRAAAELAGDALESQLFELAASERECRRLLRQAVKNWTEACVVMSEDGKYSMECGVAIVGKQWQDEAARAAGGGDE